MSLVSVAHEVTTKVIDNKINLTSVSMKIQGLSIYFDVKEDCI